MTADAWILIAAIAAVLLVAFVAGFVLYKRRRISLTPDTTETKEITDKSGGYTASGGFSFSQGGGTSTLPKPAPEPVRPEPVRPPTPPVERTDDEGQPHIGDDAAVPRDASRRGITDVRLPEPEQGPAAPPEPDVSAEAAPATAADTPEGTAAPERTAELDDTTAPTVAPTPVPEAPVQTAPVPLDVPDTVPAVAEAPVVPEIDPTAGRLTRLRGRLARSQNAMGKSLLGLLGGGDLDEDSWEEIEDTLVMADLGTASTVAVVERLREEMAARSVRTTEQARAVLRDVLIEALRPELDRSIRALPHDERPSVLLVVGVNGTGKTTTTGKLARVLVADGRRVLLGAADTFRAAAADQLQTWGERVGAETVRGKEGADPAAVAFDAVSAGIAGGVDAVLVDTAGRLHTKTGLMDELGKVKRVVEKKAPVDEVLLVLDATVGQNGLTQARVFREVVDITGVVLTKLDGTAKGGIVFQVQHELGVPVKLVGLGEGADDLAPFEPGAFVDALLG
ncbi:signal recognition particle-docking protein FtsY [Nocardia otitidiscaviarum]|uniref:signal recognition particle-docking protein FtsY n=1 Tax=Nocardia otitidiscaviarum TaxID=1823 RepID=UPI0004A75E2F|nr:signal recognition particle-docking protein FtsY [Nocardia otitidiscaviarum]MBF6132760.1 signal recognition particle-docking protein FtsY [Nocardia otitidiscaviarum]MBF6486179.1 signal recognition particle-docking protein FtsY [Nocardia otitidiscaviarum]